MIAPLDPRNTRARIEPRRFWTGMAAVIGWSGLGVWLDTSATWRGACNWRGGGFRGLFNQMHCSGELLSGGAIDIALFVFMWSAPLILGGLYLWNRSGGPRRGADGVSTGGRDA